MPLTLSLRVSSSIPLEVDSVKVETVRRQSADQVKSTLVQHGNKQIPVGEFFDVSGSAAEDDTVVWEGDCSRVKLIGARMTGGTVRVEGNAGMHLGAEMSGGDVIVSGNAGDWVGAEMHGGRIHVGGNAGHLVGSVYRGGRKGMTGGEILIDGDAGDEIGHSMRRGIIAIGGRAGDAAGVSMIAGSIIFGGETGIRYGPGMRRGSLILLEGDASELLPTFRYSGTYPPTIIRILLKSLSDRGWSLPDGAATANYNRYHGDGLELGKGEILTRVK